MIAPYMVQVGYESQLVIANCQQAQFQWLKENSGYPLQSNNWIEEIVIRQIEDFKPDILYLADPIQFEGKFLRKLNHQPKLVLGWRAALVQHDIDWSGFDVMLSSLRPLLEFAVKRGVKYGELFAPGFPPSIVERVQGITPSKDIVFVGQYTQIQHAKRGYYLQQIARTAADKGYTCAFHLSGQREIIPTTLKRYLYNPVYGLEMHKALRVGRIAFDSRGDIFIFNKNKNNRSKIDISGKDPVNMRIFEATGSGVFLLTEHFQNVSKFFEVGKEIETFTDEKELIEKIEFYIEHPDIREKIARRGQEKCLKYHSIECRARELDRIIRKHLAIRKSGSRGC
ncbi:MAG: glycosyltransferase [Deltaproteobacteria bacterium]|nr:glycosyltransferase [Deltaproteobacteria bacterium]